MTVRGRVPLSCVAIVTLRRIRVRAGRAHALDPSALSALLRAGLVRRRGGKWWRFPLRHRSRFAVTRRGRIALYRAAKVRR